jgi:hypothetical protein
MDERLAACPLRKKFTGTSMCDRPYDCSGCALFIAYFSNVRNRVRWLCFNCIHELDGMKLLGYFSSGNCDICNRQAIVLNAALVELKHSTLDVPNDSI